MKIHFYGQPSGGTDIRRMQRGQGRGIVVRHTTSRLPVPGKFRRKFRNSISEKLFPGGSGRWGACLAAAASALLNITPRCSKFKRVAAQAGQKNAGPCRMQLRSSAKLSGCRQVASADTWGIALRRRQKGRLVCRERDLAVSGGFGKDRCCEGREHNLSHGENSLSASGSRKVLRGILNFCGGPAGADFEGVQSARW